MKNTIILSKEDIVNIFKQWRIDEAGQTDDEKASARSWFATLDPDKQDKVSADYFLDLARR